MGNAQALMVPQMLSSQTPRIFNNMPKQNIRSCTRLHRGPMEGGANQHDAAGTCALPKKRP